MRNFVDIDGVDNSQNDRVWAGDRADTNKKKGGINQRRKISIESNGLVGCLFHEHNVFGDSR